MDKLRNSEKEFPDLTLSSSKVHMWDGDNEGDSSCFVVSNIFSQYLSGFVSKVLMKVLKMYVEWN